MARWRLAAIPALMLAVSLAGCSITYDTRSLGVPVTMTPPAGTPPPEAHFKVHTSSVHALFGLISLSKPSLQRALATQLVGGKGVAGLTIKTRSKWSDILITVLTLGVIAPRTITFEGYVVDPQ